MHGFANRGGSVRKETGALSVFHRKAAEAAGNIEQVNTGFLKLFAGIHRVVTQQVLTEHTLELAFRAIAEATQEAVLNSLCCADAVTAEDGRVFESIATYL